MGKVERFRESGDGVILMSTAAANKLVDAINALVDLQVSPQGFATLKVGDKNSVLDFVQLEERLKKIEVNQQQIIRALLAFTGSAACTEDGAIDMTLNLPGLPVPG